MADEKITLEDLAGMIKQGFDENTEQHQQVFDRLDKFGESQKTIIEKLENVVYRNEFEELKTRVEEIEQNLGLAIKKQS